MNYVNCISMDFTLYDKCRIAINIMSGHVRLAYDSPMVNFTKPSLQLTGAFSKGSPRVPPLHMLGEQ